MPCPLTKSCTHTHNGYERLTYSLGIIVNKINNYVAIYKLQTHKNAQHVQVYGHVRANANHEKNVFVSKIMNI